MALVLTQKELEAIRALADKLQSKGLTRESRTLLGLIRKSSERHEVRASVAAEILHVTPQTVRNWVKRGLLEGRIDTTGHVFVAVDALKSVGELDAAMPYLPDSTPDISMEEILEEISLHRAAKRAAS